jgi:hypothetical protein
MDARRYEASGHAALSAQDLLAGGSLLHDIAIPEPVLHPRSGLVGEEIAGFVRLRPLSVGILTLISRAARDDASLVPLLMIKEAMVEPAVSLDQVRQMHIGLVHFLVGEINQISGLGPDGESYAEALRSPITTTHLLLAKHFGWTPEQVSQLTPAQVMVYLAGIEKLLAFEAARETSDA